MIERMSSVPPPLPPASPDDPRGPVAAAVAREAGWAPLDADARAEVRALLGPPPATGHRPDLLLEHLHTLNDHWGGLHAQHLGALAQEMDLPVQRVTEVAAACSAFEPISQEAPQAALTVRVCQAIACRMAGCEALSQQLPGLLGPGLRVVGTGCLGRCDQAPAVLVGQVAVPRARPEDVLNAVLQEVEQPPGAMGLAHGASDFTGYDEYRAQGGYALLAALASGKESAESVLAALEQSGLCSATPQAPAGVSTATRWRQFLEQPAPRVLVLNAAGSGPGQCKERELLEREPHRVLDGLLIAAQVTGCQAIFVALRDDYHDARALLQSELERVLARPPCKLPHLELRRGSGSYVGGEPSALLLNLQGRPALPPRPGDPGAQHLFGRPVLVEQLETLYWVREIVERGPQWFAAQGRAGHRGLRLFGVSGRVRRPGAKLAPAGITLRDLIEDHCGGMQEGHELYAWLPGGAGGGVLPARLADLPLDFDTLQAYGAALGPAAIVVLSQQDRARDAALEMMRFVAAQSCGQCTPCRVGTALAARLMTEQQWDAELLEGLDRMIADTSICAIGRDAPTPLRCVQRYFRHEIG
jgi:formate dehydrogenase